MKARIYPHEFFRIEFDELLREGPRQESMLSANAGEAGEIQALHAFWDKRVLPLILTDDQVFAAAKVFVETWSTNCFDEYEMVGSACLEAQSKLHTLQEEVIETIAQASLRGWLKRGFHPESVDLKKASDFYTGLALRRINSPSFQTHARGLFEQAKKVERQRIGLIMKLVPELYAQVLPHVLIVVRRALESQQRLPLGANVPVDLSDDLSWWESRASAEPGLDLFVNRLRDTYKVMRNAWDHPNQWEWCPKRNTVRLREGVRKLWIEIGSDRLHRLYRRLDMFADLGIRGILSAYCERTHDPSTLGLVEASSETFPDSAARRTAVVRPYPLH